MISARRDREEKVRRAMGCRTLLFFAEKDIAFQRGKTTCDEATEGRFAEERAESSCRDEREDKQRLG